tara:strand:- start:254 stop:640 length:387 start_codon:yes stop_codon:yes gene_type:complete
MSILKEEDKVRYQQDEVTLRNWYRCRMSYQYKKFNTMKATSRGLIARTIVGMYVQPLRTKYGNGHSKWCEVIGMTEDKAFSVAEILGEIAFEKYILHCRYVDGAYAKAPIQLEIGDIGKVSETLPSMV